MSVNRPPFPPHLRIPRPLRVLAALLTLAVAVGTWVGTEKVTAFEGRGVETAMPDANAPLLSGRGVGVQVFLDKEAEADKVRRTVAMLKEGGIASVRQTFSWCELEKSLGTYWDAANNKPTWQKFDTIVDELNNAGIGILARLDTAPTWARPGMTNMPGECQRGPPNDLTAYGDFVRTFTTRYRGKITAVQIWNEPNLTNEWGGTLNVVQYVDMLRRGYKAAKEGDPNVLVVTAALAPTKETDPKVGVSDLLFYEQLYQNGAKGAFDVLAVNVYGLGEPPDDRRLAADRFNVSRPILVHQIMERYGDTKTPIWATEYGYNSLPKGWEGEPSIWGPNVDEQTQARYLVGGLERMTSEWPWMGQVFIWGFRWAEPPGQFGYQGTTTGKPKPEPYFALVNYDFTPRPAWKAVAQFARDQTLRTGRFAATDPLVRAGPGWNRVGDPAKPSLIASAPDATLTIPFTGTDLALIGAGGIARVAVDGEDKGTVAIASTQPTPLATNLRDGRHLVTLRPVDSSVPVSGFVVGRRAAFGWVGPLLMLGMAMIGAGAGGVIVWECVGASTAWSRGRRAAREGAAT